MALPVAAAVVGAIGVIAPGALTLPAKTPLVEVAGVANLPAQLVDLMENAKQIRRVSHHPSDG